MWRSVHLRDRARDILSVPPRPIAESKDSAQRTGVTTLYVVRLFPAQAIRIRSAAYLLMTPEDHHVVVQPFYCSGAS